ncbi:MAG TPA: phosphoglycerate mutase family protein [Steroidobacteraceae bacterium]|nr:phosphoglycerate mutase family protein [Steroidobacteraceae bacterium]
MEPPAITRHRRPFLAPLWVILLVALAIGVLSFGVYRSATATVVFLVQPLEKEPGTIADPPVTPEGEERARRLAHMFGETGGVGRVDAVYVSDDRRALQTGAPLLERLHRAPVVFRPADARAAADRAVREHSGGTVLMIASGSSLAQIVQELAGTQLPAGAQDDPDLVWVVSIPTFGRAHLVRFRY